MNEWRLQPRAPASQSLHDFLLDMTTDFATIDFPNGTMSPTTREGRGRGHHLVWAFERAVTGRGKSGC